MTLETDPEKLREIADRAEAFAREHVIVLCEEMHEWGESSILREGRVRELARLCKPMVGGYALSVAEGYVRNAAFEFVANQGKTSE